MAILRLTLDSLQDLGDTTTRPTGAPGSQLLPRISLAPSVAEGAVHAEGLHAPLPEDLRVGKLPWSIDLVDPTEADPTGWGWEGKLWPVPHGTQVLAFSVPFPMIADTPQHDGVRTIRIEDCVGLSSGPVGTPLVRPGPPGDPGKNAEDLTSVTHFGAKGDGKTDDTPAVNAALAALGGGVVTFPAGRFMLSPERLSQIPDGTHLVGQGAAATVLTVSDHDGAEGNLIRFVHATSGELSRVALDGNRANQAEEPRQYGLYVSSSRNVHVHDVEVRNWNGVGAQIYDCDDCTLTDVVSAGNAFHGFEIEQSRGCTVTACAGRNNDRHGLIITPGEVGSSGAYGNRVISCTLSDNHQYGLCVNWDNASSGAQLSSGNIALGCTIARNAAYGVCLFGESRTVISGCYITDNGFTGIYGYQTSYNTLTGNQIGPNSVAADGAYDEITLEGAADGFASAMNLIASNTIMIDGDKRARWAVNEGAGDTPNTIVANVVPQPGRAGRWHLGKPTTLVEADQGLRTGAVAITADGTLPGDTMGLDAPFGSAALRVVNLTAGGGIQFLTPSGESSWWAGGKQVAHAAGDGLHADLPFVLSVGTPNDSAAPTGAVMTDDTGLHVRTSTGWKLIPFA